MEIKLVISGDGKIVGIQKREDDSWLSMFFPETKWRIGKFVPDVNEVFTFIDLIDNK